MGTRALVHFKEGTVTLVTVNKLYDGYPSILGADLKKLLAGSVLVNGYVLSEKDGQHHNGMGCLAATVIKGLKDGIGDVYITLAGTSGAGEQFVYTIHPDGDARTILLTVQVPGGPTLYSGPIDAFDPKEAERKANDAPTR